MPFGEIDSVGDFVFCQDHGFEICGRCCTDLRICNNPRVEEYLDTLNFEDGSFEQAEAYEIALAVRSTFASFDGRRLRLTRLF